MISAIGEKHRHYHISAKTGVETSSVYQQPVGIQVESMHGRPTLSTVEGGRIAVDPILVDLWKKSIGKTQQEIQSVFQVNGVTPEPEAIATALACLAEAGLLYRSSEKSQRIESSNPAVCGKMVSVVIVNYNSQEWLEDCLESIFGQTYQPIELILVDNASDEDPTDWLNTNYPSVKVIRLEKPDSLASAINQGIGKASGDYYLVLNPDVRLEPDAIEELETVARDHPACAAVAPKLKFWWAPVFLNGLGNLVGAFGWGSDIGLGHLDLGQFDSMREAPSACFAAALIKRSAWEEVGLCDAGFSLYYEDTEWSYRARLLGYEIRTAPKAVIYHAFGRSVHTGKENDLSATKMRRVVYGRLRFAYKILSPVYLIRFLVNYLFEDVMNCFVALFKPDWSRCRAIMSGWTEMLKGFSGLLSSRRTVQSQRKIPDRELFRLQRHLPPPLIWRGLPELTWDLAVNYYMPIILSGKTKPVPEFEGSVTGEQTRPRLLIISNDIVEAKMAGPGIRYTEMARALKDDLAVTLAVPGFSSLEIPGVQLVSYTQDQTTSLQRLVESSDIALISSFILRKFPFLRHSEKRLIVDLYDPFMFENLYYYLNEPSDLQETLNLQSVETINQIAQVGDFFICGSERQRDLWIGVLVANQRVNPRTFSQDHDLRSLVDVVGIGFPDREPEHRPFLRGIHPLIPSDSRMVLWGGGVWNWLDPLSLVKAWPRVLERYPNARLIFLGTRHPNPLVPSHVMAENTEAIANEIGEKDRTILFFDWLPYDEREWLLCEADIGVTLHPMHIETRYAIRTRVFDYFWAGLPVLVSDGDVISEWIREFNLGVVVPPQEVDSVVDGLVRLLGTPKEAWAPHFEQIREIFAWSRVVEPLRQYCLYGDFAPDRNRNRATVKGINRKAKWHGLLARVRFILRNEGLLSLATRSGRYLRWKLATLV